MSEERRQILEMVAAGQITADEADRLLEALGGAPAATATPTATKAAPKYLRVIVDAPDKHDGPVHINIRVPIMLLRAGVRLASLIPPRAQDRVNRALHEQGVNLDLAQIKPENIDELIDQLRDVTVNIDHRGDDVNIMVFAE